MEMEKNAEITRDEHGAEYQGSVLLRCRRRIKGGKYVIAPGTTAIAAYAFAGNTTVEEVEIPPSVRVIGSHAFMGCRKLHSVVLPDALKVIPCAAFMGCSHIVTAVLPRKLEYIGEGAFMDCHLLNTVQIPGGVKGIDNDAFAYTNLPAVQLPRGLIFLGDNAFYPM